MPVPLGAPLLVFLHEGLGSVSMWRDFPQRLCEAVGLRGLVYSRPGYGRSTARPEDEKWPVTFMHHQAHDVLPAVLDVSGIDTADEPVWLFGHSDGGSIALLHAARSGASVAGCIVLAPHLFVEDLSVDSIARAREAYRLTDLRDRLARHHQDVDSAFWGWNDIWLDPAFRQWNIERDITGIGCPTLAIQGLDDEYGTLAQIEEIESRIYSPLDVEILEVPIDSQRIISPLEGDLRRIDGRVVHNRSVLFANRVSDGGCGGRGIHG